MTTLLIAEHDNASVKDSTNKALTAAAALGADVHVLVAGENAKGAADAAPVATWSQQEVEAAQARCAVLLKNLSAVAEPEAPLREGSECGTPAPMRLKSLGRSQVAFSPPPVVTCELIAVLAEWLERDVQPAARKHLGAPVARIQTMSSYSCRNAYGPGNAQKASTLAGWEGSLDSAGPGRCCGWHRPGPTPCT